MAGINLPTTPAARHYLLNSKIVKDSLMEYTPSPRIIFIGGSNLIYGLNSNMIKDTLDVNPINAGSLVSVGLIFMIDNSLPFIKPNDIVVMAPEYEHFFGKYAYGGNDLFRLLMDVDRSSFSQLRKKHWPNLIKPIPTYFISKFDPKYYFNIDKNAVSTMSIFNEFGDSNGHWGLENQDFPLIAPFKSEFNPSVIEEIRLFDEKLKNIGATFFVTFPVIQSSSFDLIKDEVAVVEAALRNSDINVLGSSERYIVPDSLMFNSPYHPNKVGVDQRTKLFLEDLKQAN